MKSNEIEMESLIEWIELHPGTAAWVQAVFTIIAIGVAIAVPWSQHRWELTRAQEQRRLQARALANAIYLHVLGLFAKAHGATGNMNAHYLDYVSDRQFDQMNRLKINPASELKEHIDKLWVLGPLAADPLLQAISIARNYDDMIDTLVSDLSASRRSVDEAQEARPLLLRYPDSILKLEDEIKGAFKALIDSN